MLVIASPPPDVKDEMYNMLIRLLFSQLVVEKLGEDNEIDSYRTLAGFSDDDITSICGAIRRPVFLVSMRMPDRRNQIYVLVEKNLKLSMFMFKMME